MTTREQEQQLLASWLVGGCSGTGSSWSRVEFVSSSAKNVNNCEGWGARGGGSGVECYVVSAQVNPGVSGAENV